jgi:hypothetical protein
MASTHSYKVALHCTTKQPVKVNALATRVSTELTTHAATFPSAAATVTGLVTANNTLGGYIAQAKGNHAVKTQRDAQCVVVYNVLNKQLRPLVDGVANGDTSIIALSGFDSSAVATAHTAPDSPTISTITDGSTPGTAKVVLAKKKRSALLPAKAATSKQGLLYTAQTTAAPVTATSVWTNALKGVSSRELVLTGLVKGHEIAARVRAEDGSRKSAWSDPFFYLPRTTANNPS